jgi:serine/threonine kinase 16
MSDSAERLVMIRDSGPGGLVRLLLILVTSITSFFKSILDALMPKFVHIDGRRFRLRHVLGTGAQSLVYLASESDGRLFAIKQMRSDSLETLDDIKREIASHRACVGCDNVMPLIDAGFEHLSTGHETASLLFPLMSGGSLQDAIDISNARGIYPPFSEVAIAAIGVAVCKGLKALHESGRAHRDVCPRNILLRTPSAPANTPVPVQMVQMTNVVVTDLGSCAPIMVRISSRSDALRLEEEAQARSSMPYRAPELWSCDPGMNIEGQSTDIFAVGCTLYACAFGYSPFESTRSDNGRLKVADPSHNRVLNDVYFPARHSFSQPFCDFILKCLEKDPKKRISVAAAANECARLGGMRISIE